MYIGQTKLPLSFWEEVFLLARKWVIYLEKEDFKASIIEFLKEKGIEHEIYSPVEFRPTQVTSSKVLNEGIALDLSELTTRDFEIED